MSLLLLAERVEALTRSCRTIDAEVSNAVNWNWQEAFGARYLHDTAGNSFADLGKYFDALPRYTASLEAAMSLVPDGWNWLVRNDVDEPTAFANVSAVDANNIVDQWDAGSGVLVGSSRGHNYANAATPALALTAACLRALHAIEASKEMGA